MKKTGIGIMCLAALLLAGCGATLPNMTDEEADIIGEYAAITLLKYDVNSRSRLVDLSQMEELEESGAPSVVEPEPLPEKPSEETPDIPDTSVIDISASGLETVGSLESFLELPEGLSLANTGYELCQSYQGAAGSYFALEASEGKELLVLQFTLQNQSGASQEINLLARQDNYRVTVNGSYNKTALTTMLTDDLSTYKGTLAAGSTEKVVLVFEVDPVQTGSVDSITLNLKNDSKTYTIQVL
ncbi:MAG: hypothetical protein K2N81_01500 [Acetatifactor sp.]|nr:hypothetical protein [Acetatifactor sp.]